jgi:hypothetical protein
MMVPRSPPHLPSDREDEDAQRETITLRARDGDYPISVLVLSKRVDRIQIMLNEGAHSVFCELRPTPDARAYVGTSLGREIVYERSRAEVEADIARRGSAEADSPSR